MNIYCELKRNRIRLKINTEEIEIRIRSDFYSKIRDTEMYHMFLDKVTNGKVRDFVARHRKGLGVYGILKYIFMRNRALVMLDRDVQELMTLRLVHAYATLSLDARVVYIIKRPDDFDDDQLETLEDIPVKYSNDGQMNGDTPIAKLS